ncbi:Uncharacterized protein HZ326_3185 [Fusarium oxysporum f. sp. albedinis]|nr:Uncharacterized protein HZ326_3185 [Fusarium oxysporum f. sp. albedinis]
METAFRSSGETLCTTGLVAQKKLLVQGARYVDPKSNRATEVAVKSGLATAWSLSNSSSELHPRNNEALSRVWTAQVTHRLELTTPRCTASGVSRIFMSHSLLISQHGPVPGAHCLYPPALFQLGDMGNSPYHSQIAPDGCDVPRPDQRLDNPGDSRGVNLRLVARKEEPW